MNKPEVITGIAVLESLSADASLAMDGWIRGYLYPNGVCKKLQNGYLCYYPEEADDSIRVSTIAALNDYLRNYVEPDDPKPFRAEFERSEEYAYVGELRPQRNVASDAVALRQA